MYVYCIIYLYKQFHWNQLVNLHLLLKKFSVRFRNPNFFAWLRNSSRISSKQMELFIIEP